MPDWTDKEMEEFTKLVDKAGSRNQMDRISSRLKMPLFIKKHTSEKCDRMFEVLMAKR